MPWSTGRIEQVTCACQASGVVDPVQMIEDALVAVAGRENPIHPIRARQMQKLGRNGLAGVLMRYSALSPSRDTMLSIMESQMQLSRLGKRRTLVESAHPAKRTGRRPI